MESTNERRRKFSTPECEATLDEDGYPTNKMLDLISNWKHDELDGLMKFIEPVWKFSNCRKELRWMQTN